MQLLDGKTVSGAIYEKLLGQVEALKEKNVQPRLVIIQVGNDPASASYIKSKLKASLMIGVQTEHIKLEPENLDTKKLLDQINQLNADPATHGILVQLPLPKNIDESAVIKAIDPKKDVDGFTATNLGKMFLGRQFEDLVPCTPMGVIRMLEHYNIPVEGKEVVMVGASNIVGKPMATMLINRKATVTICNSKTQNLSAHTRRADILIVAVGRPKLITAEMVKDGAVVVDVGINRVDGKLVGDTDFENVAPKTSYITPVPGGCGLMTVACLMENVVQAAKNLNTL